MADRKLGWQSQNQFLQARHGFEKGSSSRETIAVALPLEDNQAFDLLCWTINMAAQPGDTVVGLRQRDYDVMQKFISGNSYKHQLVCTRFKALHELCDLKQVSLEIKAASVDVAEKLLMEEVAALNATMLVVTIAGHNLKRQANRTGNFFSRQLPVGCSVVVVKDYKIYCYKENKARAGITQRVQNRVEGGMPQFYITISSRSCESPGWFDKCKVSNYWSPKSTRATSPKRVLDSTDLFYESDGSPFPSEHSALNDSLLKRALRSCSSSSYQEVDFGNSKRWSCSSVGHNHRNGDTPFFCAAHQYKLLKEWKFALRSMIRSLWVSLPWRRDKRSMRLTVGEKSWKFLAYEEVLQATSQFSPGNLVGRGGHSEVFKGLLNEGEVVAVKRLIRDDVYEQRTIDFLTEIGMICHALHPNITPLIGCCIEKGLFLVYKFMRHGNLAGWLYGGKTPALNWSLRYKIALGIARGLNYLHSGCNRRIIHRDIKASNILLGSDFEPQISDFGLAKWLPNQCSHHVSSPVEGTFGYLAPEYVMNGIVDEKTDVFSYGVLLLELVTGRKAIGGLQSSLVLWARPFLESMNIEKLVDVQLNGEYDTQEMQSVVMAAALCVQQSPECRPSMSQVLQLLTDEQTSDGPDSCSALSSQSFCLQDALFESDYSSTHYQDDLRRHKEIALEF